DLRYVDRGRRLQEEVRSMIKDENVEILELIEIVKRLGLNYHFEEEIGEAINRLLREYGYDVSEGAYTCHSFTK
ncbi:tricyclene synthase EBOS chloroplastic-like, partial [Trifolium medium]|nr:tricyclene synthase EBOS chloroplastic-like [Trifolium medium]